MLDKEIIENLQLPFASFRLFALEQAIKTGNTKELLALLGQLSNSEDSSECQVLLPYAITAVKNRLAGAKDTSFNANDSSNLSQAFADASGEDQIAILIGPALSDIADHVKHVAEWLKAARNDAVAALVLSTFSRVWPDSELGALKPLLFSESLSIRMNALQILIQKSPTLITSNLPELLISNDPRFRALAIRGLASIDMDEALAHFDFLLNSASSEKKLSALQISIHLPFARVCPCLVKFMAIEQDKSLLAKAGVLLASNPDPDVPFRLWEIAMHSSFNKQEIIKKIIQSVCDEIKITRMLNGKEDAYMLRLQRWIYRYGAATLLREYIDLLPGASNRQALEMEIRLKKLLKNDGVREVFVEAQNWSVSEKALSFIKNLVQTESETVTEDKSAKNFCELSVDEQIRYVTLIDDPEKTDAAEVLLKIMQNIMTEPDLSATAFRSALRMGRSDFVEVARTALSSDNPNLQSAALEYMAEFATDELFIKLGQYLKSLDLRVKRTALRVLKKQDQDQAVSSLKAMLSQNDMQQYHSAIACMIHFPFSSVRPLLLEFLQNFQSPDLLSAGLCLFQANPDPESLYLLFRLQQQIEYDGKTLVGEVLDSVAESLRIDRRLGENFSMDTAKLEWQKRYRQELEKQRTPAPYSLQMTFPETLSAFKKSSMDFVNELYDRYKGAFNIYFVVVAILFIVAGIRLYWPVSSDQNKIRAGAIAQNSLIIDGTVTMIDSKGEKIFLDDTAGKQHVVLAARGTWKKNLKNTRLKLKVTPFRINQTGLIISQFQAFEE
ncbi:MAG: hypothetical protein KKB51_17355 [Candidatus Riflebacteria bacterium]|nr:hypothetical protein [Candidatus Riflebacteria bacterium]